MKEAPRFARLPFFIVVALCILQVSWWVYFQYNEAGRVEASERTRLEGLCYRAVVALAPSAAAAPDPHAAFIAGLARDFPDLELGDHPGPDATGVPVDAVLAARSPALTGGWVRPRAAAVERVLAHARSRRRMFASEGIALMLVVLAGVVLLYAALHREMEIRRQHASFLAGATHEMKTPIATLRLGLQTLEQGWTEPEMARRYLHQMVGQVDRLRMQIDNLLRTATGDGHRLNLLPGDLAADLREVAEEMQTRCAARQVVLALPDPLPPVPVRRDKEAIQQVLRNLLDNALKYSPDGGRIEVSLAPDGARARLCVRDEGPGIAATDRPHVFERFYRGATQTTEAKGGTGLGLWVARAAAVAHGGTLEHCRGEAGGACFELTLPLDSGREITA